MVHKLAASEILFYRLEVRKLVIYIVLVERKFPITWRKSSVVPLFKGKGNAQECVNYKGTKLMSHSMKFREKIINKWVRMK